MNCRCFDDGEGSIFYMDKNQTILDILFRWNNNTREKVHSLKIVAINGSPRIKGNTSNMIRESLKDAEALGNDVYYFDLANMAINDCKACMKCKKDRGCSQQDDMTRIYPLIEDADVLVLGSPIYMGDETGLMKCFIDRLYCFLVPNEKKNGLMSTLRAGKRALVIFTCQMPNGATLYNYISVRYFNLFINMLGFEDIRTYIIGGANPAQELALTPQAMAVLPECRRFVTNK
ncbi:MAG: NAD(P)H-dependent oxidoreductase [Methanomassiliicoccales archaeon]